MLDFNLSSSYWVLQALFFDCFTFDRFSCVQNDLLSPKVNLSGGLPPFPPVIRRVCSGYGPVGTGLQTRRA